MVCFSMFETAESVGNIDEIHPTPGRDGVHVGPAELALCLGRQKHLHDFDHEEPEFIAAIRHVLEIGTPRASRLSANQHGQPDEPASVI